MAYRFTTTTELTDDTIDIDSIGGYIQSTFTNVDDYMIIEEYVTEKRAIINAYERDILDGSLVSSYTCDTLAEAEEILEQIKLLIAPSTMSPTFSEIEEV